MNKTAQDGRKRTLALMGKPDSGYWNAKHTEGQAKLARLNSDKAQGKRVPLLRVMFAHFAAGDSLEGYKLLEQLAREHERALYRLPCQPDVDEVRPSPRFQAIMNEVGPLPSK